MNGIPSMPPPADRLQQALANGCHPSPGDAISKGWALIKPNLWLFVGGTLVAVGTTRGGTSAPQPDDFSHDSNMCRKNVAEGVGRLRYSVSGTHRQANENSPLAGY